MGRHGSVHFGSYKQIRDSAVLIPNTCELSAQAIHLENSSRSLWYGPKLVNF